MSKANLKMGDVVLVKVDPRSNNGSDFAPALVTRALNAENDGNTTVNVRVFHDGDAVSMVHNVPLLTDKQAEDEDAPAVYCKKA